MTPNDFLERLNDDGIVKAIAEAERATTGEIRVYVSHRSRLNAMDQAKVRFEKLGMTKTKDRNGVLIFVAPVSQTFAVIGDLGIHQKCGQAFWDSVVSEMRDHFKQGKIQEGVVAAIQKVGQLLTLHFPKKPGDQNELPNQVIRDAGDG